MQKKLVLILATLFFVSAASAQIQYEIRADEDRMFINNTIKLSCEDPDCPVNRWTLSLNKPDNATVVELKSLQGDRESYNVYDDKISIETFMNDPGRTETVFVRYRIDRPANEIVEGMYNRDIGLPGFRGESNSGRIQAENLLSGQISETFEHSVENDTFKFRGEGPTNADINFGDGYETTYYEFFASSPGETEEPYRVTVGTMGFAHWLRHIPVAMMDSGKYNKTVNRWSAGRYRQGYIVMRKELDEDFKPILAHETVHALNDQAISWDDTSSTWFDEGVAKHIEFLMRKKMEGQDRTREVFGEERSYVQMEDGERYRYTLPPKGDKEKLWNYYENDLDFMKRWNSQHSERSFGYAYSELIIRNYILQMDGSISELYNRIGPDNRLKTNDEKWQYYSEFLDLTPCKYESRERFNNCLEEINSHDYPVYVAESIDREVRQLQIRKIEVPNKTDRNDGRSIINRSNGSNDQEIGFVDQIRQFILSLTEILSSYI